MARKESEPLSLSKVLKYCDLRIQNHQCLQACSVVMPTDLSTCLSRILLKISTYFQLNDENRIGGRLFINITVTAYKLVIP